MSTVTTKMNRLKTKELVFIALFGVISYLLARFTKFPIFPNATFLKFEFGEFPLILAGYLLSPLAGIFALGLKELLSLVFSGSNILGLLADFLISGSYLLVFSMFVRKNQALKGIVLATVIALLVRTIISIPVNILVLYLQFGTNIAGVLAQMPLIILFNIIKPTFNTGCFVLLYPKLKKVFVPAINKTID